MLVTKLRQTRMLQLVFVFVWLCVTSGLCMLGGRRLRGARAGSAKVTRYVGQKAPMAGTEDLNPRGWRGGGCIDLSHDR